MKRRDFLKSAPATVAVLSERRARAGAPDRSYWSNEGVAPPSPAFTPCINQATTMKADFKTALDAYSKAGFRLLELWLDSVTPFLKNESVAVARRVMADHGIEPRSSCCDCENLFFRELPDRDKKMDEFKRRLDLSAQLGARRFVLCSGVFEDATLADYAGAVPKLHEIGDLGRQFDIIVGVEFIRGAKFLGCLETTAKLLRKVAHPNLGVLMDTFHFYAGTSKLEDIEALAPNEITWVHINDVPAAPRELLGDQHRVYVGEGVMPLERILRALGRVYEGPVSLEVFQYAAQDPYQVAKKGLDGLSRLLGAPAKFRSRGL